MKGTLASVAGAVIGSVSLPFFRTRPEPLSRCAQSCISSIMRTHTWRTSASANKRAVPLRVTLGKRTITDGTVDLRMRRDGSEETLPVDGAAARIAELSKGLRPR